MARHPRVVFEQARATTKSLPLLPKAMRSWTPSGIGTTGPVGVIELTLTALNCPLPDMVPATYKVVPFNNPMRAAGTDTVVVMAFKPTETAETLAAGPPPFKPPIREEAGEILPGDTGKNGVTKP